MAQHDDPEERRFNKELAKYAAHDTDSINKVIATLMEHDGGQRFLWWLLQQGKYGLNPFSPDPLTMAFTAGEMNVGNAILQRLIEVNPMGFAQLQMTRKSEDDRRIQSARNVASGGDLFDSGSSSDSSTDD